MFILCWDAPFQFRNVPVDRFVNTVCPLRLFWQIFNSPLRLSRRNVQADSSVNRLTDFDRLTVPDWPLLVLVRRFHFPHDSCFVAPPTTIFRHIAKHRANLNLVSILSSRSYAHFIDSCIFCRASIAGIKTIVFEFFTWHHEIHSYATTSAFCTHGLRHYYSRCPNHIWYNAASGRAEAGH